MSPVGLEPTIAVGERAWTYVLDRAVTGTGGIIIILIIISVMKLLLLLSLVV
jgi:hypothetical protein